MLEYGRRVPGIEGAVGEDESLSRPAARCPRATSRSFMLDTSCCPVYISSTTGRSGKVRTHPRGALPVTKKEIVRRISDRAHLTQLKTKEIVQWTFDAIIETLIKDGRIELRNFGVFEVRRRKARRARNPRTNDRVDVPEKNVVTFQPGKEMEERVRKDAKVYEPKRKKPKPGANAKNKPVANAKPKPPVKPAKPKPGTPGAPEQDLVGAGVPGEAPATHEAGAPV